MMTVVVMCEKLASESDMGKMNVVFDAHTETYMYVLDEMSMVNKIIVIMGVDQCECIGATDLQKINQLDYLIFAHYLYAFTIYASSFCVASDDMMQRKTSLRYNLLNDSLQTYYSTPSSHDLRIHGESFFFGIQDFLQSSHYVENSDMIEGAGDSGGFFFMIGTVMLRPCMLFPWYTPWLLDSYGTGSLLVDYTKSLEENQTLFDEYQLPLFANIVADMIESNVITKKHLSNLRDNTGENDRHVLVFEFQAAFIHWRYVREFMTLIGYFVHTPVSPFVYVPFIYQLMFQKNQWDHWNARPEAIYALPQSLLTTCDGVEIEDTMNDGNLTLQRDMYYFVSFCGDITSEIVITVFKSFYQYLMATFWGQMLFGFLVFMGFIMCCISTLGALIVWKKCLRNFFKCLLADLRVFSGTVRYEKLDPAYETKYKGVEYELDNVGDPNTKREDEISDGGGTKYEKK